MFVKKISVHQTLTDIWNKLARRLLHLTCPLSLCKYNIRPPPEALVIIAHIKYVKQYIDSHLCASNWNLLKTFDYLSTIRLISFFISITLYVLSLHSSSDKYIKETLPKQCQHYEFFSTNKCLDKMRKYDHPHDIWNTSLGNPARVDLHGIYKLCSYVKV